MRTLLMVGGLFAAFAVGFCPVVSAQVTSEDRPVCGSHAACDEKGTVALRAGRLEEAVHLFEQEASFAEMADIDRQIRHPETVKGAPCKISLAAYDNLSVAYFEKHDYPYARAWALAALRCDDRDSAARENLSKAERALLGFQWPKTPRGLYVQYAGRGTWQTIIVDSSSEDSVHICFSGLWWGAAGEDQGPSGIGDLRATLPLHLTKEKDGDGTKADYKTRENTGRECMIFLGFFVDKLEAMQLGTDSDCGFGHNVMATGTYQRVRGSAECPPDVEKRGGGEEKKQSASGLIRAMAGDDARCSVRRP